jgi:hypothetical protein
MVFAVLIGAASVWYANRLLTVKDPPPVQTEPVLSLVLDPGQRLSWATTTEYQVHETFSHCENPVTVEVDALVNGTDIGGPITAPNGYAHGELKDPLGVPSKIELLENLGDWQVQWDVPQHEFVKQVSHYDLLFGAPLQAWYPSAVRTGMSSYTTRAVLVKLQFQENWVLPRSTSTCFVRFPTLQAPLQDPTSPADTAAWAPAAGPGEVSVVSTTGEIADSQTSIPPPTDPRIPQWSCASMASSIGEQYSAANCGGVAVFSAPGTDSRVALWLLVVGAFIGVAAALFVDQVTEPFRDRKGGSDAAQRPGTG